MKVLFTSDWHVDAVTFGLSRLDELDEYWWHLHNVILAERVDLVVVAGDFFDPGSMLHAHYEVVVGSAFQMLASATTFGKIFAIAGNHDVLETNRPLSTVTPICRFAEFASVYDSPAFKMLADERGDVGFLLLPYFSRTWADAELGGAARGPMRLIDEAIADAQRHPNARIVVVGHMTVPGAMIGSESVEMSRGRELDLPAERIRGLNPRLVVNGHYHRPQVVTVDGLEVVIPGSPLSFTTDDPSDDKGYVLVEL